jgi:hypothetical protein
MANMVTGMMLTMIRDRTGMGVSLSLVGRFGVETAAVEWGSHPLIVTVGRGVDCSWIVTWAITFPSGHPTRLVRSASNGMGAVRD